MRSAWRSVLLAVLVSLTIAAVALFILFRFFLPARSETPAPYTSRFVVGDWEGQVAVFEGQKEYPMQIFDMPVSALPEDMQKKVQAGIPVEDETELSLLLEDYTS